MDKQLSLADFGKLTELTMRNLERRLGKSREQVLADCERQLEPHRHVMGAVKSATSKADID